MQQLSAESTTSTFDLFFLRESSYEELKKQMVEKFTLFDAEVFDELYKFFRGHVYFYRYYYWRNTIFGYDNDRIIQKLIYDNYMLLTVCLQPPGEYCDDINALLIQLKESNFRLVQKKLTNATVKMIECNALFYNLGVLKAQNPLLERVIKKHLR